MTAIRQLLFAVMIAIFWTTTPSYAKSDATDVDKLFQNADLIKLVGQDHVVNLVAQFKDPYASTKQVSDFDSFIAIGSTPDDATLTEFDKYQDIIQQVNNDMPWMGVSAYKQTEIANTHVKFQAGLTKVKACMKKQHKRILDDNITRLVVYKTIHNQNMIYDYVFVDENLPAGKCQEVLYVPAKDKCEDGMVVLCHSDLLNTRQTQAKQ